MFAAERMMFSGGGSSAPVISGTAYPGNTLTSTQAGQWYVNGSAVSGETASTYVIRLNDIGYTINQTGSNTLTCWSPADIAAVAGFWTPYRNVYNTVGPEVAATNGQNVARWTDIKSGNQLNVGASTATYDTAGTYPFLNFGSTDRMDFSDLTVFKDKTYGEIFWSGKITANGTSASNWNAIVQYCTNSTSYARLALTSRNLGANALHARSNPLDNSTAKTSAYGSSIVGTNYVLNARAEWITGGNLTISRDNDTGVATALSATANTPNTDSAAAMIGYNGLSSCQANGEYRCICLVNASLTATERSQIARYMGLFVGKDITLV